MNPTHSTHEAIDAAAREHYGRLLSHLAFRWRDPAAAEDALSEAFAAALQRWPVTGVPDHPEAWLLTVAKNHLKQAARHLAMQRANEAALITVFEDQLERAYAEGPPIADERLRLMYVCAHPAIDRRIRAALMLQLVLGVEVGKLAAAFLVPAPTLAQRLVRAKHKIRAAGIPFEHPEAGELFDRTHDVLEAIYGAYTRGRALADVPTLHGDALGDEALRLAELVVQLSPGNAEAMALLALFRYCEARRDARFDEAGAFVPLAEQQTSRWRQAEIEQAELLLRDASKLSTPGPYQLEAAIQSCHSSRLLHADSTPWPMIVQLYAALIRHWPTVGAQVGFSVALAECGQLSEALAQLDQVDPAASRDYPAYWAARAHVLTKLDRAQDASPCYRRAAGLTEVEAVRAYLLQRACVLDEVPRS